MAIKKLKKSEMIARNKQNHVKAERDVLTKANNPWVVDLKLSFQDDDFLYLVMEYLPGGDLMKLLMDKDILTEEECRFYMAESVGYCDLGARYRICTPYELCPQRSEARQHPHRQRRTLQAIRLRPLQVLCM